MVIDLQELAEKMPKQKGLKSLEKLAGDVVKAVDARNGYATIKHAYDVDGSGSMAHYCNMLADVILDALACYNEIKDKEKFAMQFYIENQAKLVKGKKRCMNCKHWGHSICHKLNKLKNAKFFCTAWEENCELK